MNKLNTIFILGYPRSGTTWFANLFNSHPDIAYRHEMIGRCYRYFPDQLFKNLKYNDGLSDDEYTKAIRIVIAPNVESDRPPFFHKNYLPIKSIRFHYLCWLACRTTALLNPLYRLLFYPRTDDLTMVIKETRSSVNMDSMLTGLRAKRVVILFRHPCGALASSLSGISSGKMSKSTDDMRLAWFTENENKPYIKKLALVKQQILDLPEHEYLAILWRQQNEDYLNFPSDRYEKIIISYEDFMVDREAKTRKLFDRLAIRFDPDVAEFIDLSSGNSDRKPVMKDSSSSFYSVYRNKQFDPDAWKKSLTEDQISDIEKHTMDVFQRLLDQYHS